MHGGDGARATVLDGLLDEVVRNRARAAVIDGLKEEVVRNRARAAVIDGLLAVVVRNRARAATADIHCITIGHGIHRDRGGTSVWHIIFLCLGSGIEMGRKGLGKALDLAPRGLHIPGYIHIGQCHRSGGVQGVYQ
ncbi:hypothetical protein [Anaerovibrio sp.]|uniref:hypothetical protein n=1 Tax=Anaerovibrio sp. TaxID=1872532 RepID=UPI0025B892B7|nr:hypothetical protein [Anaerovibrio sp.]